jgi:hypothetical protein
MQRHCLLKMNQINLMKNHVDYGICQIYLAKAVPGFR